MTPWDCQSKRVYSGDNPSPTVTADWHVPAICLQGDGSTSQSGHGMGYDESGASYTLNTLDRHSVCFQQNQRDEVRLIGGDGDVAGSLSASQFTKCQNYVCMSGTQEHSNVEVGGVPCLTAHDQKDAPVIAHPQHRAEEIRGKE